MYERAKQAKGENKAREAEAATQAAGAQPQLTKVDWRGACTADIQSVCGGKEDFGCLAGEYKNDAASRLSKGCSDAIMERSNQSQASADPQDLWKKTCKGDIRSVCPNAQGGNAKVRCLDENKAVITTECYDAMVALFNSLQEGQAGGQQTAGALPPKATTMTVMGGDAPVLRPSAAGVFATTAMTPIVRIVSSGPAVAPAGFGGLQQGTSKGKPKGKGKGKRKGKGKGKGKGKRKRCPKAVDFKAGTCDSKIRMGFGLDEAGVCVPVLGCRNQNPMARRLKLFPRKQACNRLTKKC